jgi:hypothetical protein
MVYILQEHSRFDVPRDVLKMLKKANMQRNMLAHRFFTLHARDMLTDSGCARLAKKLLPTYQHLFKVDKVLDHMLSVIFHKFDLTLEEMERRREQLLRDIRAKDASDAI